MSRSFRSPIALLAAVLVAWLALAAVLPVTAESAVKTHDKEFWRSIKANEYAVPEGEDAFALTLELYAQLGSTDPEIRDGFGYSIPAVWIYRQKRFEPVQLQRLVDTLTANLRRGIGEQGTDSVLLRSFSALDLSVLAAANNQTPYLEPKAFAALLDDGLAYLLDERDVRGWVEGKGWLHSAAHTADLIKFLARNPLLRPEDQGRILDTIATKLAQAGVFTHGEDERLARAVLSLVQREDFDRARFDAWVDGFVAEGKTVWQEPFDHAKFAAVQNDKHLMRALLVMISGDEPTEAEQAVRTKLLAALQAI